MILAFKSLLEDREKLGSGSALPFFQEQYLRRGTGLLLKLPDVARNAPAPGDLLIAVAPGARVHRCNGDPWTEHCHSRPMGKRQCTNLQNGLLSSPNHRSVHHASHGFVQILAVVSERRHENTATQ